MFSRQKYRLSLAEQLENIAFAVIGSELCVNASDLASEICDFWVHSIVLNCVLNHG
jgi:hypothetical protein